MALSRVAATPPQGLFPSISPILQAKAPRSDRRRKAVQMSVQGASFNGAAAHDRAAAVEWCTRPDTPLFLSIPCRVLSLRKVCPAAGNGGAVAEQVVFTPDGHLAKPMKLSAVVTDAVRRWYLEAERDAQRGDVVSGRAPHALAALAWCVVVRASPLGRQPSAHCVCRRLCCRKLRRCRDRCLWRGTAAKWTPPGGGILQRRHEGEGTACKECTASCSIEPVAALGHGR